MTDTAAILDGGDGGAPAAPAANQGAPASAPGSQPAANGAGQPWYAGEGYTDEDRVYMENKGWTKLEQAVPAPVLKSYRELEKVMGGKANAVILPKPDDEKGMDELFTKLGRPEQPDGYKVELPAEHQEAFGKDELSLYQQIAHGARMTGAQFNGAMVKLAEARAAAQEKADTAYNADVSRTKEKLTVEMGEQFGENVARGNLAMRQLGLSPDERDAISEAIGVEKATRMLMKVGGFLSQHKAVGLDNGGKPADGFVTDKARAMSRITSVNRATSGPDADFRRDLLDPSRHGHKDAVAQWREWNRVSNS
jgi:hypothetical protein